MSFMSSLASPFVFNESPSLFQLYKSLDFTTSPTCKQIRVIFQIQAGTWGANISPLDVDNVKLTGTSRTYSPKIGFENNNAEIEYFTYDLSGAYAPEQPEITINITE